MNRRFKIVVERSDEGYVAYPIGLKGVVVGDGDTFEDALANVKSAIAFHIETFGHEALDELTESDEIFFAETDVTVDV